MKGASQKSMYEETGEPVMFAMAMSSYSKSSKGERERGGKQECRLQQWTQEFSGIIRRECGGGIEQGWEEDDDKEEEGQERGRPKGQRR